MAKLLRIVVRVSADKIADALDVLADIATGKVSVTSDDGPDDNGDGPRSTELDNGDDDTPVRRPRDVRQLKADRTAVAQRSTAGRTRLAGKVIYTPVGTKRAIDKMMAELTGVKTMKALVLRDLATHPGSSNKEVRERIAKPAQKYGLSIESVDNVIWQLVNKGTIGKQSASE